MSTTAVRCEDWRSLPTSTVAPLLDAEATVWRRVLAWDVRDAWRPIEPARSEGRLPGFVVRDQAGRPHGWTWFLEHHDTTQVAALVADSPEVTDSLVAHIVDTSTSAGARSQLVCVRDAAPELRRSLTTRGFQVATYRYLWRDLDRVPVVDPSARTWQLVDLEPLADLCARAYAGAADVRAFATSGTRIEWLEYTTSLTCANGCGRLLADASYVEEAPGGTVLHGAVMTTDLGFASAHIAQLVVDPAAQGRGIGRRLLDHAIAAARARAYKRITLLVADTNTRACQLYASAGFQGRAEFVVAARR